MQNARALQKNLGRAVCILRLRRGSGFELDSAKSAGNVEITADGSAVKNVYFSRRTFTIKFYREDWRGRWSEDTSLRITAKYGEDVSARWEAACEDDGWGPNKNDNIQYTLIANMPRQIIRIYLPKGKQKNRQPRNGDGGRIYPQLFFVHSRFPPGAGLRHTQPGAKCAVF